MASRNFCILTGTSRGLGEAIASKLIETETILFCVSRNRNEKLISKAELRGLPLHYFEFDLGKTETIESLIYQIMEIISRLQVNSISLINNAGVLGPVMPIDKASAEEIEWGMKVNSIAPMILASQFIKQSEKFNCKRTVMNITSGAAQKPYYGWGVYCSSKASLDMFTKVVALEQQKRANPVKIFSVAPGVVETAMQEQIRNTDAKDFATVERFKKLKENGQLLDPFFVAEMLVVFLNREDVESGGIYDIREFLTS